jgi:signal transduction histidine kinase
MRGTPLEDTFLLHEGKLPFALSHSKEKNYVRDRIWENTAEMQALLDGISEPLLILGDDFSIKALNHAAAVYYGVYQPQKVIGQPCYETLRAEAAPCNGCPYPSVIRDGNGGTFERQGMMDPERFEQVVVHPTEIGILLLIRDITKASLMERQVIQNQKLASLGLLVSGVVHEIKNLNNCITFNVPLLKEYLKRLVPIIDDYADTCSHLELFGMSYSEFREDLFRLLDNLEHASGRINGTVSGLSEFVGKNPKGQRRWIDLKQAVERGVAICRCQIKKTVNSFEVDIAEDLPVVFTEPDTLEQVLVNLLINAAQATDKEDSWVRLTARWSNGGERYVMIEVTDNGCGMDEDTKERIFEPFFTTKTSGKGTGLGLFVSHNLIEELGGRIEVESEPGKGSSFRVVLCNVRIGPSKRSLMDSDFSAGT